MSDEAQNLCLHSSSDTCGDCCNAFPQKNRQRNQRKSRVWRG